MSETKAHLEELQSSWLNVERGPANSMANALNSVVASVFAQQSLIGYELIQNADDAAKKEGLSVEVDFFILHDYLLIRHNGAHFTPADVKALSQYGARTFEEESENSTKQRDLKKTGYKGIGFKSVFSISDEVSIFSDKYNFKFDKSACPKAYPWQIIPYATSVDNVPENIQNYIEKDKVIFLIKIKPEISREKLKNSLKTIFANYKTILFLRHTSSLELFYEYTNGIQSVRRLSRKIEDDIYHLETADKDKATSFTRWKIDKFKFDVPDEVRQSVKELDQKVCPDKLKEATSLELFFAAKLREDNTVIPLMDKESYIFSYLPTQAQHDFPFVVNGNFLLNPARTKVLENRWNEFLFEQIGYFQFEWFKGMAKDEKFKYEFARLIKKYADSAKGLNGALNKGVKKAQLSIAFIPVIESSELKKSPETIVDKTQISTAHQETDFVKTSFNKNISYEIADPQIKKINELIRVGANEFNIETLKDTIRQTNKFKTPETNAKLIDFFHKRINEIEGAEKSDWNKVLKDTTFVLDKEKNLKEPKELYFPQEIQLPFKLEMAFVHEFVFNQSIAPNEALQKWMTRLGLAVPNPIEIIRRGIYQLLEEEKVTQDNVIAITQYIYNNQTGLIKKDYEFLGKKLPIMTNENQLKQAGVCHLSSNYHPKLPLEEYLSEEDIFVNSVYLSESTAELNVLESDEVTEENTLAFQEINGWKRFFSRLGVKQEMELDLNENSWNLTKQESKNHFRDFTNYLNTNKYLPKYNSNNSHSIFTWLKPHYIEHTLNNHEFAIAYWQILLEPKKWRELQSKSKRSKFSHSGGQVKIPSNFNFIVETNPHFPATDENCYPTIELYSHSLKDIVEDWSPVAYFDISPDKEAFLNIKSTLSIEDCLEILTLMETTNEPNKEKISKIYSYLIDNRISKEQLTASPLFSDTFKLLAVNNSFQPKANLIYLNLPRFAEKVDSAHFLYTGLPEDKATLFCDLMDISTIQLDDLVLVKEQYKEEAYFSEKWLTLLPLIDLFDIDSQQIT